MTVPIAMTPLRIAYLFLMTLATTSDTRAETVEYETKILVHEQFDQFNVWNQWKVSIRRRYSFTRDFVSELIVIPIDSDSRMVVSQHKLRIAKYQEALDAWENDRQKIRYLRLSCLTMTGERCCICGHFKRDNSSLGAWINIGLDRCAVMPSLRSKIFEDFGTVNVLDLSNLKLPLTNGELLDDLEGLEIMFMNNVLLSSSSFLSIRASFCHGHLHNLTAVNFTNVQMSDGDNNTDGFRIFECTEDDSIRYSLNVSSVIINYCNISGLTDMIFSSINPTTLLSLDLSRNIISSIDEDTFTKFVNLLELILSHNRIVQLLPTTLHQLQLMRYFDVSQNLIETFSTSQLPSNTSSLNLLRLADNGLRTIDGFLGVIANLIYVHLDNNALGEARQETFQNCSQLMVLTLRNNSINVVDELAFRGCENLRKLQLDMNNLWDSMAFRNMMWNLELVGDGMVTVARNKLKHILPNSFVPISNRTINLVGLGLSYNKIAKIERQAFLGLLKLKHLWLDHNDICALDMEIFQGLTSLRWLDLSGNRLIRLFGLSFLANTRLTQLDLRDNRLTNFPENTSMPPSLERLYLHANNLSALPLFAAPLTNLHVLDVSSNQLHTISRNEMACYPNVTNLFLRRNLLSYLPPGVFADNTRLLVLSLDHNLLDLNFTVDYFGGPGRSGMSKLQKLFLNDNQIRSTDGLFKHQAFRVVRQLNISNNPLGGFKTKPKDHIEINQLYARNCSLSFINQVPLITASKLNLFDLTGNGLSEFRPLRIPASKYEVFLYSNPILCSCRMKWLRNSGHYRLTYCQHAVTRQIVPIETIPDSEFLCRIDGPCLTEVRQCECYTDKEDGETLPTNLVCANKGLDHFPTNVQSTVKVVNFSDNKLRKFSTESMPDRRPEVTQLYLDNNLITELDDSAFVNFPNLEIIGLSGNRLSHFKIPIFMALFELKQLFLHDNKIDIILPCHVQCHSHLNTLSLHSNQLHVLDADVLLQLNFMNYLRNLSLHDNPWKCPCDNSTFKNWIQSHANIITNTTDIQCNGSSILSLPDEYFSCSPRPHIYVKDYLIGPLSAAVSAALFLLISIIGLVSAYRHRHVLQVKLYNSRYRLRLRRPENVSCFYDAVIMYDSDNDNIRQWTENQLRPRLLEFDPRFELFVPDVDLGPGVDELNTIVDSVTSSRRTIVVLDEGSYENPYVLFSFKVAYHRMTTDDKLHDVLLVLTDDFDVESLLDADSVDVNFRAYLTAGKRLRMSHQRFWEELNYFMPEVMGRGDSRLIPGDNGNA